MSAFTTQLDIINRAFQHIGQPRIQLLNANGQAAAEARFAYDKVREAELRANLWRFAIRRTALRPISLAGAWSYYVPPIWSSTATYGACQVVQYDDGTGLKSWINFAAGNIGNVPGSPALGQSQAPLWVGYIGNLWCSAYSSTADYFTGEIVLSSGSYYMAASNMTNVTPPSGNWQLLAAPLNSVDSFGPFFWPINCGPVEDTSTHNVYPLPTGFLRIAPQEPSSSQLSNPIFADWRIEDRFIITRETQPVVFRYVADIFDVVSMDGAFCEGLAAKIALKINEIVTQSSEKAVMISRFYDDQISSALGASEIETSQVPMGDGFQVPEDIANRGLQHLGADLIASFTDNSKEARATLFCYDKLRKAELRRNNWRFAIKRIALWPISSTSRQWTPPVWAGATTYPVGAIVSFYNGFETRLWQSTMPANLGNTPGVRNSAWANYFGATVASQWNDANIQGQVVGDNVSYYAGDLVYTITSDGVFQFWSSLSNENSDEPTVIDQWVQYNADNNPQYYMIGDVVQYNSTNYISLIDENYNIIPGTDGTAWSTSGATVQSYQWIAQGGTSQQFQVAYPVGVGPVEQAASRNAFPLPYGYIRTCSQDPKAGSVSLLGAPSNNQPNDWYYESRFITSMSPTPITLRFVAEFTNVAEMDAMFCEGLAARIGMECAETLRPPMPPDAKFPPQSRYGQAQAAYMKAMGEARTINGIETGIDEPPLDDWLGCRM
jgi:hypothetical protein